MKKDWTMWLAGGIVATFLLSGAVTWALVQDQKATYTHDMDRILIKLDQLEHGIQEVNARLAKIEGRLEIE